MISFRELANSCGIPPAFASLKWPVEEADNRIRIVLSAHAGTWRHVSLERLTYANENAPWEHVRGSANGYPNEDSALKRVKELLAGDWEKYV